MGRQQNAAAVGSNPTSPTMILGNCRDIVSYCKCHLTVGDLPPVKFVWEVKHTRRIKTEEKAKAVVAFWGTALLFCTIQ